MANGFEVEVLCTFSDSLAARVAGAAALPQRFTQEPTHSSWQSAFWRGRESPNALKYAPHQVEHDLAGRCS